jgi:hypothetical protein
MREAAGEADRLVAGGIMVSSNRLSLKTFRRYCNGYRIRLLSIHYCILIHDTDMLSWDHGYITSTFCSPPHETHRLV